MAEVWIKWVKGLVKRREVVVLARKLNLSCREAAAACMELWEWADGETTNGHIQGATRDDIDLMLNIPGFAEAFESPEVGWVRFSDRGCTLSRWERNHGESAKKRALEQRKKKRQRDLEEKSMSRPRPRKRPASVPKHTGPERELDEELKPSTTPNQASISSNPLPPNWATAAAGLREEGVRKADEACQSAIANGCAPSDVSDVLCHFRGKKPAWNGQDLYFRVIDLRPGEDFTKNWRPGQVNAARVDLERSQKKTAVMSQTSAQIRAENKRARDAAEAKFGPVLDAMTPEARAALVEQHKLGMAEPTMQREQLLAALEARTR